MHEIPCKTEVKPRKPMYRVCMFGVRKYFEIQLEGKDRQYILLNDMYFEFYYLSVRFNIDLGSVYKR